MSGLVLQPIKKIIFLFGMLAVMAFGFQANAPAESYRYDVAGRLIRVAYDDGSGISYTYDNNGNILLVERREVASDINADGRVDLLDFARLQACFTGTGGGPVTPQCESADLDGNGAVDLDDFAQFQNSVTGT